MSMPPKKKKKVAPREQPRYIGRVLRSERELWKTGGGGRAKRWVHKYAYTAPNSTFEERAMVYQDVVVTGPREIRARLLTQGASLMLACRHLEMDEAGYNALPERERYRCVYQDGVYFYAVKDPHIDDVDGKRLLWATPGGLVQEAEEIEPTEDEEGRRYASATGDFMVIDEQWADSLSLFFLSEYGASLQCRMWYSTWRDVQDGALLTYEREVPDGIDPVEPEVEAPAEEPVEPAVAEVAPVSERTAIGMDRAAADVIRQQQRTLAQQREELAALAKERAAAAEERKQMAEMLSQMRALQEELRDAKS
jgi:hypothetical protein